MKQRKPKILIYDIETAPMLGYVWSLWENNVALNQLHRDWNILSWAAKWLGDEYVYYDDQSKAEDIEDESAMLQGLHDLLVEADIVVTHNGKRFDEKKLNARFFHFGMGPVGKKRHIDTKQLASSKFAFTSNKLEYLTHKYCSTKKLTHQNYPGFSLWLECLKGNQKAWKEMRDYNIQDVLSLEELYTKMAPWDESINMAVYNDDELVSTCGHDIKHLVKRGYRFTNTGKFQKYQCSKCNRWSSSRKNLIAKDKRKKLKGQS